MGNVDPLLLDIWREACRHIEIAESAQNIAQTLARRMPIVQLSVVILDWETGRMLPSAMGMADAAPGMLPTPQPLKPADVRTLRSWVASGRVIHQQVGTEPHEVFVKFVAGDRVKDGWLLAPLSSEHGVAGALLVRSRRGMAFDESHAALIEKMTEPFSVALDNHHRLHELNALREAAEADKRSALSRLGREGLMDTIIGGDAGLRPVMERVALVARSDIPVLILGETGSGKEVIARAIHEKSQRHKGPFIRVNCGAIPAELMDSELFGHEKGAFTGATAQRRGWFERADEGTLLLDEIGELPPPAQVRLLRVLQEGTFERVGGEKPVHVRVRIVAATHRDLPAMVQDGRFREDLWYRVSGFPILLPPLRERKEDVQALAVHFAERAARRFGLRPRSPSQADLALLKTYHWPGNIRELASVMDRAAILGDGLRLEVAKALGTAAEPVRPAAPPAPASSPEGLATLDEAMKRHIEAALASRHGRVEGERGIARMLNINPHTLRARMRKLGIDWKSFR